MTQVLIKREGETKGDERDRDCEREIERVRKKERLLKDYSIL